MRVVQKVHGRVLLYQGRWGISGEKVNTTNQSLLNVRNMACASLAVP